MKNIKIWNDAFESCSLWPVNLLNFFDEDSFRAVVVAKLLLLIGALTLAFSVDCLGDDAVQTGRVHSVNFESSCSMPVSEVSPDYQPMVDALQWTVGKVPEGVQLVSAIGLLEKQFGLSPSQAADLKRGFGEAYEAMDTDPQCVGFTSALHEMFATDPNRKGHYFVYVPEERSETAPTIVFLHGYGGNLKFYIWALKIAFPDSVIIAPTWGISWQGGDVRYVDEVIQDVEDRFQLSVNNKWLMGLSSGGPAGFDLMNDNSSGYRGYVCMASGLSENQVTRLSFTQPVLMLNGTQDQRFPIQFVRRSIADMQSKGLSVHPIEIDADHFFLLTQRTKTLQIVDSFIKQHSAAPEDAQSDERVHWWAGFLKPWAIVCFALSCLGFVGYIKLRSLRIRSLE